MKYLSQAVIILAVTAAAETLRFALPLPIPASIYGLVLLFLLLKTGILKLSQVEDVGGLLLELMPLILVPASVSIMRAAGVISDMLWPVLLICFVGTPLVMVITGRVAQAFIRRGKGDKSHD